MYVESDGFACRKDTTQMTRDSQAEKTIEMLCFFMFIYLLGGSYLTRHDKDKHFTLLEKLTPAYGRQVTKGLD